MFRSSKSIIVPTLAFAFLAIAMLLTTQSWAQTPLRTPALTIEPADVAAGDAFGWEVAAKGALLLVGAPGDVSSGDASGALYVYQRDRTAFLWHQVLEILPEQAGEEIGLFATDGNTFAYTTDNPNSLTGPEVHIWERGGGDPWEEVASFNALQTVLALAIDGDDLVVLTGSVRTHNLLQSFRVGGAWQPFSFGTNFTPGQAGFDLQGDALIAGSSYSRRLGPGSLFPAPTPIRPPAEANVSSGGGFGDAVAFSEDGLWLAIGSSLDALDGESSGSVYLYAVPESGQPTLVSRLSPADAAAFRRFGAAVRFDGQRLAVSAPGDPNQGVQPTTYILEFQAGGGLQETLRLDAGEPRLALAGNAAFVGVPSASVGGEVLVYSLDAPILTTPEVTIDPLTACSTNSPLDVTGSVNSSEAIALLNWSSGGALSSTLCMDCGLDPTFEFSAPLNSCQENEITITAQDTAGQTDSASATVYFDDADPEIAQCLDQVLEISALETFADAVEPTASDGCELVSFVCENSTEFGWPRFPIGADQPASCTATDRCGRQTSCEFTVSVEQLPGETEIESIDFEELSDGPIPPDLESLTIGGALGTSEISDGALQMRLFALPSEPEDDVVNFVHTEPNPVDETTRFEVPVPTPGADSAPGGRAGVMLRLNSEPDSPMVWIYLKDSLEEDQDRIEFEIRAAPGIPAVLLAPPILASDVTHLAITVLGGSEIRIEYSEDDGETWTDIKPDTPSKQQLLQQLVDQLQDQETDDEEEEGTYLTGLAVTMQTTVGDGSPETGSQRAKASQEVSFRFASFTVQRFVGCLASDNFDDNTPDAEWTLVGAGYGEEPSVIEADGALQFIAEDGGFFYRSVTGDFRMEATVDGAAMTTGGKFRRAGLVVRQSLDRRDIQLFSLLAPFWADTDQTRLQFAARKSYGRGGFQRLARDVRNVPKTIRLAVIREGQTLRVEYSVDNGATWLRPPAARRGSITLRDLEPTLLVGLGVVNNASEATTAHFDDFSLCRP